MLPKDIENIIYDYLDSMEHYERFQPTLRLIELMTVESRTCLCEMCRGSSIIARWIDCELVNYVNISCEGDFVHAPSDRRFVDVPAPDNINIYMLR